MDRASRLLVFLAAASWIAPAYALAQAAAPEGSAPDPIAAAAVGGVGLPVVPAAIAPLATAFRARDPALRPVPSIVPLEAGLRGAPDAAALRGRRASAAGALERTPVSAQAPASLNEKIVHLRPTQMSVGQREVDAKTQELRAMRPKDLERYLRAHPVPVVLGPQGRVYIIDHHHLARAAWEAGVDSVPLEVKADLSRLSVDEFWRRMKDEKWVYPYDQFGGGPHDPMLLPENVKGMADDPFRSVAGKVRELGGYEKSDEPFAEFLWADFFRKRLTVHPVFHDFDAAVQEALRLAKSPAARNLPGFSGK